MKRGKHFPIPDYRSPMNGAGREYSIEYKFYGHTAHATEIAESCLHAELKFYRKHQLGCEVIKVIELRQYKRLGGYKR